MSCDSGLELNFLQEFYLVALDVFKKSEYAERRDSKERLAGWLSFFCTECVEEAEALCGTYPWLLELYAEMAEFGRKPEELMTMFSEMLREMDRNTIRYMVDDMKEQIEKGKVEKAELEEAIAESRGILTEIRGQLTETEGKLTKTEGKLTETEEKLTETEEKLTEAKEELTEAKEVIARKDGQIQEKDMEIAHLRALLAERQGE